jgi:D-alanyl-lipoteichoic acid acyltransferase DltB (MBOAT superfamily)
LVWSIRTRISSFGAEKWFLLAASYLFYMTWNVPCVLLIMASSLMDYTAGRLMGVAQDQRVRRVFLICSVCLNLGLLSYFKYRNFFADNIWTGLSVFGFHPQPIHFAVFLPVGISFFTFQSMTYTIDVYRRKLAPCRSLRDFMLYVAFFPQLISGPIVRAVDFLPQLAARRRATWKEIEGGLFLFLLGAVKKTVISDGVAPYVDLIFADPGRFDALSLFFGVLGYAVQIYCDFSGYSDMAIGCARILGFHFPENFMMPYASRNITEFWRRWHITLSSWLRDYLYIPLGGNRKGVVRTYINILLTMLLGGLWHGARWNFVIWGGLLGLGLVVHKLWMSSPLAGRFAARRFLAPFANTFSHLLTLTLVCGCWIFFRAQTFTAAAQILKGILTLKHGDHMLTSQIFMAVGGVTLIHLVVAKDSLLHDTLPQGPMAKRVAVYTGLLILLVFFAVTDGAPFIYFQF